jgi:serine/threonine protein phosphatase 1
MDFNRLLNRWRNRGAGSAEPAETGRIVQVREPPQIVYAIGDVHGCLDLLRHIEAEIAADAPPGGEAWIVVLGDVIDRGPASAQVLDHLLGRPPAGLRRLCLRGNHESLMLAFLRQPRGHSEWFEMGGLETLASYGMPVGNIHELSSRRLENLVMSHIPNEHVSFLEGLPLAIEMPDWVFVHAGLKPGRAISSQREGDLLWYRDDFAETYEGLGKVVVHGHTPVDTPMMTRYRIDVDTGAYYSGRLSAVRLSHTDPPRILSVSMDGQ